MTNGFGHTVTGEEFPQAVKQVLEDMAAEAALARLPHDELNHLRSRLQSANMAGIAHTLALAGSSSFDNQTSETRGQYWALCQGSRDACARYEREVGE